MIGCIRFALKLLTIELNRVTVCSEVVENPHSYHNCSGFSMYCAWEIWLDFHKYHLHVTPHNRVNW